MPAANNTPTDVDCPCGNQRAFTACCGQFLTQSVFPTTSEELMRSRYTAFAMGNTDYLMATWHLDTRPTTLRLPNGRVWTGLKILRTTGGTMLDDNGTVDFIAHFRDGSKLGEVRENSTFGRVDGKWMYISQL